MSQPARVRRPLLLVWWALFVAAVAVVPVSEASAAPLTTGGFTTSVGAAPARVTRGATVSIDVTVTADTGRQALVDLEVYGPSGAKVFQHWWDGQSFAAGQARTLSVTWTVPSGEPRGVHTVKVGVFSPGWGTLYHWNNDATTFRVSTSTTPPPSTTTTRPRRRPRRRHRRRRRRPARRRARPRRPRRRRQRRRPGGRFETLPVGATLPSDATCAALVRDAPEIRPANATFNQTRGQQNPALPGYFGRVTGNFVGTTDEIIQWAACKWGLDEDVVRAQTAKESWWFQRTAGDFTTDPHALRARPSHRRRRATRAVPRVDRRATDPLPVLGVGVPARHDVDRLQPRRGDGGPA